MKHIFLLAIFSMTIVSCSKKKMELTSAVLDSPSAMIHSCQSAIDDILTRIEFEYKNNLLIKKTSIKNGEVLMETTIEYNSNEQIVLEVANTDWKKTETNYLYNGNKQLVNVSQKLTNFDENRQVTSITENDAPREYGNNKLIKEWEYWGGFNTYEYSGNKVIKKIEHKKNGKQHHFTFYKYSKGLLVEEKKETSEGSIIFLKTYTYDSQNRLLQVRDQENIIEENDYDGNRLIEKREYYFGIDPGYFSCNGNNVYMYEY